MYINLEQILRPFSREIYIKASFEIIAVNTTLHFIRVVIIIDNKISIDLIGFEVNIYLMIKDRKIRFKYSPGLVLA